MPGQRLGNTSWQLSTGRYQYIDIYLSPPATSSLNSKERALTLFEYSPLRHPYDEAMIENTSNKEPSRDAFNNLPFQPPRKKLELNHSDYPTLCNQEVEEVQIPRSVSISESLSCNTDRVNEHPHEDELAFI